MNHPPFPDFRFKGTLRPSQEQAVAVVERCLAGGDRRLHIVAPPGSGKTVLGLYVWAHCVRSPALVLSPNSAIQAQWAARLDLFDLDGRTRGDLASLDPQRPGLITSLTYQAVTLPARGDAETNAQAIDIWKERLIEKDQAHDPDEADFWIADLERNNPDYYKDRVSHYRRQLRELVSLGGESLSTLHASSKATLARLKEAGVGLIILDECHHLLGHWGRVLEDARDLLDAPIVLGLTATPPDLGGRRPEDVKRYSAFFGPVDFEVPIPALVKERNLAPYQDLAYFIRPSDKEVHYIAEADRQFHDIVAELCAPPASENPDRIDALPDWVVRVLSGFELPTGRVKDWVAFERRDKTFADAARLFLESRDIVLPENVPPLSQSLLLENRTELSVLVPVLDRYIRHGLRRSADQKDHKRADETIARLRMLGMQVTETGTQPCASPVGRVMAYSRTKVSALLKILKAESRVLGDRIRAIVVTDFEKTSATKAEVEDLMDEEVGGAIAAFRALLTDEETDALDPILLTASTLLVDDDLVERFKDRAGEWLRERGHDIELTAVEREGFYRIHGQGADWCPRVYVQMITDLFQEGVTRCLVGTRGLLGEGWDANRVNVLVDLTTVTTSMAVNQLRGRSVRLDPDDPNKLSDNWDVVCVAGEFSKGLDDYTRFMSKHKTLFGVSDDGVVEKGVGHVHAAFTEMKPEGIEGTLNLLNDEMLKRAEVREKCRDLWQLGESFDAEPLAALEFKGGFNGAGFQPFKGGLKKWSSESLTQAIAKAVWFSLKDAELIDLGGTLYHAMRAGGYARMYLKGTKKKDSELLTQSLREVLGPLDRPRYVIPRYVKDLEQTWLSWIFPEVISKYLRRKVQRIEMLHTVPSALSANKERVLIFQNRWNEFVSPGEAIYAHHGKGEDLVSEARTLGQVPESQEFGASIHEKEVFV